VALDILRGNVAPGTMLADDGSPCEILKPGDNGGHVVGDPASTRVLEHKTPRYVRGCRRVLESGETWSGSFLVRVREPADGRDDLELGLTIGDVGAYDYTAVLVAGFPSYFEQEDTIRFSRSAPLPSTSKRQPPVVRITRRPEPTTDGMRATISGVVTDDVGIAHVLVFSGSDKVFFQGAGTTEAVSSVPFTADAKLQEGKNFITVLATDVDGFTHTGSVVTYVGNPGLAQARDSD